MHPNDINVELKNIHKEELEKKVKCAPYPVRVSLVNKKLDAGNYNIPFEASNLPIPREVIEALHNAVLGSRVQLLLDGHRADVVSADFSPDGMRLAVASKDQTIRVWQLSDLRSSWVGDYDG